MSEVIRPRAAATLVHADSLAAWVLLGWLGMRLGWSSASGIWPVVIWWTVRIAGSTGFALHRRSGVTGLWVALVAITPVLSGLPTPFPQALLMTAAAGWGLWSATLTSGAKHQAMPVPSIAMGLMMGSLWLSGQWCLGPGWTDGQAMALHLGLMTGLPMAASTLARITGKHLVASHWHIHLVLVSGAWLLSLADTVSAHIVGMCLVVLSGILVRPRESAHSVTSVSALSMALPGPALLLAVGLAAPTLGPVALQFAWGLVAVLAAWHGWRFTTRSRHLLPAPHRWRDVS